MKKLNVQVYQGDPSEVQVKDNNNIFIQGDIKYNTGGGSKINSIGVIKDANGKTIIDVTPKDTIIETSFQDTVYLTSESTLHYLGYEDPSFVCEFPTTKNLLIRIPAGTEFNAEDGTSSEETRYGHGVLLKNLDTIFDISTAPVINIFTNSVYIEDFQAEIDADISMDDVEIVWED